MCLKIYNYYNNIIYNHSNYSNTYAVTIGLYKSFNFINFLCKQNFQLCLMILDFCTPLFIQYVFSSSLCKHKASVSVDKPSAPRGRCSIFVLAGFKSVCGVEAMRDFGILQLQAGRLAGTPNVASSSWRQLLSL